MSLGSPDSRGRTGDLGAAPGEGQAWLAAWMWPPLNVLSVRSERQNVTLVRKGVSCGSVSAVNTIPKSTG